MQGQGQQPNRAKRTEPIVVRKGFMNKCDCEMPDAERHVMRRAIKTTRCLLDILNFHLPPNGSIRNRAVGAGEHGPLGRRGHELGRHTYKASDHQRNLCGKKYS